MLRAHQADLRDFAELRRLLAGLTPRPSAALGTGHFSCWASPGCFRRKRARGARRVRYGRYQPGAGSPWSASVL